MDEDGTAATLETLAEGVPSSQARIPPVPLSLRRGLSPSQGGPTACPEANAPRPPLPSRRPS